MCLDWNMNICKWSTNAGDPTLYIKYDFDSLTIFDAEKNKFILADPIGISDSKIKHSLQFTLFFNF